MKTFLIYSYLLPIMVAGQDIKGNLGDPRTLVSPTTSALRSKTINNSYYHLRGGFGKVVKNVNAFTGLPHYNIPIADVSQHDIIRLPIQLSYYGNVEGAVETSNHLSPSGWTGMGWSLSTEVFVSRNTKGTVNAADDVFYAQGPFGTGQMLENNEAASRFYLATNPYVKIEMVGTSQDIQGWVFTDSKTGTRYVFGGVTDGDVPAFASQSRRVQYYGKNGQNILIKGGSTPIAYRWDLSVMEDDARKNRILFEYQQELEESLPGLPKYARESHVKNIKVLDPSGNEAERYEFLTASLDPKFYVGYSAQETRHSQKLFETRILDKVNCFAEGNPIPEVSYQFRYAEITEAQNPVGAKKILDAIEISHKHLGGVVSANKWGFAYDAGKGWLLSQVTTPQFEETQYTYKSGPSIPPIPVKTMQRMDGSGQLQDLVLNDVGDFPPRITSACDEQFCYVAVSGIIPGIPGTSLALEVYLNRGHYFQETPVFRRIFSVDFKQTVRYPNIPATYYASDYYRLVLVKEGFVVYTHKTKANQVFSWNGKEFKSDNPNLAPGESFSQAFDDTHHKLNVYAGSNFIVSVSQYPAGGGFGATSRSTVRVFTKDAVTGRWNAISTVDYLGDGGQAAPSVSDVDVMVSVSNNLIAIANKRKSDPVNSIQKFGSAHEVVTVHGIGKNGTLEEIFRREYSGLLVDPVSITDDYWAVNEVLSVNAPHSSMIRVHAIDGSGDDLFYANGYDYTPQTNTYVYSLYHMAHEGYLMVSDFKRGLVDVYLKKKGAHGGMLFAPTLGVLGNLGDPHHDEVVANMGESGFLVGKGDLSFNAARGLNFPLAGRAGFDAPMGTRFYRLKRDASTLTLEEAPQLAGGMVSFSFTDDLMVSRNTVYSLNPWNANSPYILGQAALPVFPGTFIDYTGPQGYSYANRLFCAAALTGGKVQFYLMRNTGSGFAADQKYIVESVTYKALTGADPDVKYTFSNAGDFQYNHDSRNYQFEKMQVGKGTTGVTEYEFFLDTPQNPLVQDQLALNGKIKRILEKNAAGAVISEEASEYSLYRRTPSVPPAAPVTDPWPEYLTVPRLVRDVKKSSPAKGGTWTQTTEIFQYNDIAGLPHFSKSLLDGKWLLAQSILGPTGLPVQSISYNLNSEPTGLSTQNNSLPYAASGAIAASKLEYHPTWPYLVQKTYGWRNVPNLSDQDLKNGVSPTYSVDAGDFFPKAEVTKRNPLTQPVEWAEPIEGSKKVYHSFFYEGLRGSPVARISNSRLENCAVLTGENAPIPGWTGLEVPALVSEVRWANPGTTSTTQLSHTGRGAFQVQQGFGPTLNLYLKDVPSRKFDLVLSAWIYKYPGSNPTVYMDRRRGNGTTMPDGFALGTPIGTVAEGRWQRWEAVIPYQDLILGGLFATDENTNGDFVRLFVGTPAGGTILVDDIVVRPSDATFQITTFDARGFATSEVDTWHRARYYERDYQGKVVAARDDDLRIINQSAMHRLGEDD